MTFSFWTGQWADSQFEGYFLHQFDIAYRSIVIPRQPIFDNGITAEQEASLDFMGGENIRTYTALLDRATTDRIFKNELKKILIVLQEQLNTGAINNSEYNNLVTINTKAWNPLEAIRSNVAWELRRRNDDRGWIPVKTIGDGEINLVRYEFTIGTLGV